MRSDIAKVGLMILIGIVLTLVGVNFLRARASAQGHYELRARFSDARNLSQGSQVLMAGVPIGFVKKIQLLSDPPVAEAALAIQEGVQIPEGSTFRLPSGVLFPTEARVEVVPPATRTAATIPPNTTLYGVSPAGLDSIMPEFEETAKELRKLLVSARELIEDADLKSGVEKTLASVQQATDQTTRLLSSVTAAVDENRGAARTLLVEATAATREAQNSMKKITALATDPRFKEEILTILETAQRSLERADALLMEAQNFASDPELKENIKTITANATELSGKMNTIADKTSSLIDDASGLTQKISDTIDDSREILQTTKTSIERVNNTLDSALSLRTLGFEEPYYRLDVTNNLDSKRYRTDATIYLPTKDDRFLLIGVHDLSESNQLIFQYGTQISPQLQLRYGIYAAKPGFGVDYRFGNNALATLDAFNPNNFQTSLRLKVRITENIYGWAGLESLFRQNQPLLGLQFQR